MTKGGGQLLKPARLICCIILFSLFSIDSIYASGPQLLIVPFGMHAKEDITELRKEIMETVAGSLYKEGVEIAGIELLKEFYKEGKMPDFDEDTALGLAKKTGAQFTLLGSVTLLDKTISADWRILDLNGKTLAYYHRDSDSVDGLMVKLKDTAKPISGMMRKEAVAVPVKIAGLIAAIRVEGNKRVDKEAILNKVSSKINEEFSAVAVKNDIHAIYSSGYFEDITVDVSEAEAGLALTFIVKEKPFIKDVLFKGNKKLSEERLKEAVTFKKNTLLNMTVINEDVQRIIALYAQDGYYLAEVNVEIKPEEAGSTVVFNIEENKVVRVKRITIIGNSAFSDRKILGIMETNTAGMFSSITGSGAFSEAVLENDLSLIMQHYYDRGYIQADILDHRALLSGDKRWFSITIAIKEGPMFRVGTVDASGDILTEKEDVLRKINMPSGAVFNRAKLMKGIERLQELYGGEGYANAVFEPKTKIAAEKGVVDLTMDIRKGEKVYVERIDIRGNTKTKDKVIRREIEFAEGDMFSTTLFKRTRNNLRRLGYFEDVRLTKSEGTFPSTVRLDVEVKEMPTGTLTFGAGYSSVDKVIATVSISQRNLMGTGVKLDFSGNISSRSSNYEIGFTQPWLFDRPISAGFDLFDTSREYSDFSMDKKGGGIRFGFPVYKRETYAHFSYKLENVDITDVSPLASDMIKDQEGKNIVSSATALLRHDTRDDLFFPTEGILAAASVETAGGFLGGDTNYVKYEANAAKFLPFPWDTTLSMKVGAGYVHSFGGETVPIFERYYLGGINSLRGFQSRSVGPRDPVTGELIGGESKVIFNTEYIFPVFPKEGLRGVVFFDAGNAYDGGIDFGDVRFGAGAGIRWYSPVGPIRLEWGYNLDRQARERQSLWEFTIGGSF